MRNQLRLELSSQRFQRGCNRRISCASLYFFRTLALLFFFFHVRLRSTLWEWFGEQLTFFYVIALDEQLEFIAAVGWTIIVSHKFIGNSVCTSSTFAIGPLIKITFVFKNAPFKPRDNHPSSVLLYPIGNLVGRSHFFLVSAVSSRVVFHIRIRRT